MELTSAASIWPNTSHISRVDKRAMPEPFEDFILKPSTPLVILSRDVAQSTDIRLMVKSRSRTTVYSRQEIDCYWLRAETWGLAILP